MPNERKTVMISSTIRDLPEHRKEVMDACLRQGMFPIMMEHLPANDDEAISASLKMVDEADIYVGVFAQRYGYIPKGKKKNPKQISITEMEYDRAIKRKIPRLIFVMDKSHPITIDDIDMENAAKLQAFKSRVQTKNIVNFFKSSTDLSSHVINSLSKYLDPSPAIINKKELPTINLDTYINAIRKRYGVLALEGLTPPQKEEYLQIQLRQVFVEQSVRENPPPVELPKEVWEKLSRDKEIHSDDLPSGITLEDVQKARETYYEKPSRPVFDVLTAKTYQHSIILGDPGSGKSTLARYVMLSLVDSTIADDKLQKDLAGYLPLLIELRTFAGLSAEGKCETPLEFLEHLGKTEGWGLTQSTLHNFLKNDGNSVVIFDGLDEIFDLEQRERITNQIAGFTNDYPRTRVIVTSRVIGYRRKILSDAGFTHFTLQDLDQRQVKAFVTRWYDLAMSDRPDEATERRERILRSFRESSSIRQLAGNPMLLTIMSIIGKHQELPRERWKLYDHAASVLIQHWDVNKHLKDYRVDADFIGEDDKKELLRRLAFRMQRGDDGLAGNYIHREGLQSEFETYLSERYSQAPDRAKVIAETMIQQFRERNFILSLYGANLFGFVHRAFLEYFCASAFVYKFEKTKEFPIEQLKANLYGKHWNDQNWHEVLQLICGMLDEKWAGEIVEYLTHEIYRPWPETFKERPPRNIALAVQCLQEIRNLNSIANSTLRVLEDICYLLEHAMRMDDPIDDYIYFENIARNIEAIGNKWPQRLFLKTWLLGLKSYESSWLFDKAFGTIIGIIGQESLEIQSIIVNFSNSNDDNYRVLAPWTLAKGWPKDPQTLSILHQFAIHDSNNWIRYLAVEAFCQYFREDAQTLPLLRDRAIYDVSPVIRSSAVGWLGQYFSEDEQTLPLLRGCAVGDPAKDVRASAIRTLAQYFREGEQTLTLLLDRAINDADENVRSAAVNVLGEYFREDSQTLSLLLDWSLYSKYSDVRSAAVKALGEYFREDGQTLPLLRDRAINDAHQKVRSAAIGAFSQYFHKDAQTLPLLLDRAINDTHENVRSAAVKALGEYFREDGQTLPLLLDRAINDTHENVRSAAVDDLAQYFHKDAQTLPLLLDRAINDTHENVRSAAVKALGEYFREDGQTLPLLLDGAINDTHEEVRSAAVDDLAQYFHKDAQTLPLLRDRAINDAHENVRSLTVRTLARYFREDLQTLPLLRDRAVSDTHENVRASTVRAIAQYFREDGQTLPLLRDRAVSDTHENVRASTVRAIARYFRADVQTLPLLRDRAVSDTHENVRSAAVGAFALYFHKDVQTLPLLLDHAINDAHESVRSLAVRTLARYFREDGQTLPLLLDRAINDAHENVRSAAVDDLAQYFREDGQTLPLLRDRAVSDTHENVRWLAVAILGQFFRGDTQTLPLLHDRAINDAHENVRWSAVETLGQYFREDAQTLPLLLDRAVNDISPTSDDPNDRYYPREVAIEAIATHWPTHPDTLTFLRERAQKDPTAWLRQRVEELIEQIEKRYFRNQQP